jgi:hypothetical protein
VAEESGSVRKPAVAERQAPVAAHISPVAATARPLPMARALQQRLGNRGTQAVASRIVARSCAPSAASASASGIGSLSISQPGDAHEREAESVANAVMRMPQQLLGPPRASLTPAQTGAVIHRRCSACEDEPTHRKTRSGEMQAGEFQVHRHEASATAPEVRPSTSADIRALQGRGNPLPVATREYFEPRFGTDFSQVRVHTDSHAAGTATSINAKAFTAGRDIAFGPGEFSPTSHAGQKLLAHELTHVVQQSGAPPNAGGGTTVHLSTIQRQLAEDPQDAGPATERQEEPNVPDAARKRATYAATVFRRMAPLSTTDEVRVTQIVAATQLYPRILEKRRIQSDLDRKAKGEESRGMGILRHDPQRQTELQRLDDLIQPGLAELGIVSEDEVFRLVDEVFPRMVLTRAKDLALSMLDENKDLALAEQQRYSEQVCTPDIGGFLAADTELGQIASRIVDVPALIESLKAGNADVRYRHEIYGTLRPGETPAAGVYDPSEYEEYERKLRALEESSYQMPVIREELANKRGQYALRYPILGHRGYVPGSFSSAPQEQLADLVAGPVQEILDNIKTVQGDILTEELKVWHLNDVLEMTMVEMGVENEFLLTEAVKAHVKQQEEDKTFKERALAALAVVTTIIASILTAPAGGWGGYVVGGLWGAYFLHKDLNEYFMESAAENVSLDPELRDISMNEPTLLWVALDAISLGLDVAPFVRGIKPMARALATTRTAKSLGRFAQATRRVLFGNPAAAEEIIERAARRFGLDPIAGAQEHLVSASHYIEALGHSFPSEYLDDALRAVGDIAGEAASQGVRDPVLMGMLRRGDITRAGTRFHSLAKQAGDQFVAAGRLPPGYRFRFEQTVKSGRGGSRLDVLIEDPLGQLVEVDWKTTGRSAVSSKTIGQMEKHATHVADPQNAARVQARTSGQALPSQRSFSWTDEMRSAWEQFARDNPAAAQSVLGANPSTVQIPWP